mmetsp:Transcript_11984/g.18770  ORF Transcript_11984/g.18770 Transcript_11984/m.18770 type:complete len:275 (-) Transcript_11984:180-1004(-)
MAPLKSAAVTCVDWRRTARMAASLATPASSAPFMPGVSSATRSRSTSSSNVSFWQCTARMSCLPWRSGSGTRTTRSKRPGRVSASSSTSYRLVAATTTTPLLEVSSPSMQASSWFSVWSASWLWPGPAREDRARPKTSISSKKMMHGAALRARSKMWRTRAAPRPTNISTNSDPEQEKKGTPASAAITLASKVFPVPGGPTITTPLGSRTPALMYTAGFRRMVTISWISNFAAAQPCTESNVSVRSTPSPARAAARSTRLPTPPPPLPCIDRIW